MNMENSEKRAKCKEFVRALKEALSDSYEHKAVGKVNNDYYLYPAGTLNDISYYGKPVNSFRYSYHWNWYAPMSKCKDPDYIQCESVDMPPSRSRDDSGRSEPRYGYQVAFYGPDKLYHCVFGEKYDRKTRKWIWVENSVDVILEMLYGFEYYVRSKEA